MQNIIYINFLVLYTGCSKSSVPSGAISSVTRPGVQLPDVTADQEKCFISNKEKIEKMVESVKKMGIPKNDNDSLLLEQSIMEIVQNVHLLSDC